MHIVITLNWTSSKPIPVQKLKVLLVDDISFEPQYSESFLLDIQLDDGLEFSFTDKRRFARVRLFEDVSTFTSSF